MTENVHNMWSEEELDQALAALNAEVPPGEQALATARAELMAAAGAPAGPVVLKPKRHWARWVAAVAVVLALVAGVLVVQTVGDNPPAASAAAQVLNNAAEKIGATDPVVKPGQYLYIEKHAWNMSTVVSGGKALSYLRETLSREWVPADRSQEWLLRSQATGNRKLLVGTEQDFKDVGFPLDEPPQPEQKAKCGDYFRQPGERPCEQKGSWQQPTPQFLAALPTDPKQLYDRLRADTADRGQDPDLEMLVYVADALRSGLVPANVRANLYRALAMVPGLEVSSSNANLDGRVGIGLGFDRAGRKQEMIIDPATGQFIGERETATRAADGLPAGTVSGYSSVSTAVVAKMGDEPGR